MEEPVSLKEHIEKMLAEKDKAINIALAAAKEAVQVAETNSEKWRSNANEWRGAMSDREKNFMPKTEFEEYKKNTDEKISILQRLVYIGIGGLIVIEFLMKYIIK